MDSHKLSFLSMVNLIYLSLSIGNLNQTNYHQISEPCNFKILLFIVYYQISEPCNFKILLFIVRPRVYKILVSSLLLMLLLVLVIRSALAKTVSSYVAMNFFFFFKRYETEAVIEGFQRPWEEIQYIHRSKAQIRIKPKRWITERTALALRKLWTKDKAIRHER